MQPQYEFDFGRLCLTGDVVFVVWREKLLLDVKVSEAVFEARLAVQGSKHFVVLYDANGLIDSDKPGRDHFSKTAVVSCKALAFFCTGCVSQTIAKLLAHKVQGTMPCGVFSNSKAATVFLDTYR